MIILLNGSFGIGKTTTASFSLDRRSRKYRLRSRKDRHFFVAVTGLGTSRWPGYRRLSGHEGVAAMDRQGHSVDSTAASYGYRADGLFQPRLPPRLKYGRAWSASIAISANSASSRRWTSFRNAWLGAAPIRTHREANGHFAVPRNAVLPTLTPPSAILCRPHTVCRPRSRRTLSRALGGALWLEPSVRRAVGIS